MINGKRNIRILQTSYFTDLGYYKDFAKNLPDDIEQLCILQECK